MTDDTTLTGPPETFDLIGAIEGSTFPETTVRFLFDSAAAKEVFGDLKRMDKEGLLNAFPVTDGSIDH